LRPRQSRRAQAARRTEVTPPKINDCESGWVGFKRGSMLAKEGKAARAGAARVGLGTAEDRDRA